MKLTKKITLQQLLEKRACPEQVSLFKQHFGSEVEVTIEGALEVAQIFNWNWAVRNLLNDEQLSHYKNIIQPAWETYKAVKQQAWEAYVAEIQPALETYKAVEQPAQEAYNRSKAEAFAKAYLS